MRQYRLQERPHPLFSPLAVLPALFLIGALGLGVLLTGGRAFSPGELSAVNRRGLTLGGFLTHADFGDECGQCHAPFQGVQATRCERCHENVAHQRQGGAGLHARFERAAACAGCHPDHVGVDFDPTAAALADFDHETTRFSLAKHALDYAGASLGCAACHLERGDARTLLDACAGCHGQAQAGFIAAHTQAYGADCFPCHDGHDTLAAFTPETHAQVFALSGAHAAASCAGCHAGGRFKGTPAACVACHAEPETHGGLFGADCQDCHTTQAWRPASLENLPFDHARDTLFSLVNHATGYDGQPLTCLACHTPGQPLAFTGSQCVACHRAADALFMEGHLAQYGERCASCHDGRGNMAGFDHNRVWTLEGKHALVECNACHTGQVFRGTPAECVACHLEPGLHAGLFGSDCAACHTAQAWQPARLTQHTFLLDHGGEGEIACATCHPTLYTQYTCYNCHAHDPGETQARHLEESINPAELPDCAGCHPTGREGETPKKHRD